MVNNSEAIDRMKEEMERLWGEKCKTFEAECMVCRAWIIFERDGGHPDMADVSREMDQKLPRYILPQ